MKEKISVLMGIYNCEDTLLQAVESIKKQTYTNWELIICDDASTDSSWNLAKQLQQNDERIIVLHNSRNCGLNVTLNKCLDIASGTYIARMDGDDECLPKRFEEQVDFLEKNSQYAIVSSPMILFDEDGDWGITSVNRKPSKEDVVCSSPICHAASMMRKSCIDQVHGYTEDKKRLRVEDVDLWIKLYAAGYKCYNLQTPLYRMRNDKNALNRRKYKYRTNSVYVRLQGCKMMRLSGMCYIKAFSPMIVGLIPAELRNLIRKYQYRRK